MKKIHFLWYLLWLLPAFLLSLCLHQAWVYHGMQSTWQHGEEYVAEVIDFRIKNMQAQSNGYIVLEFETKDRQRIHRRLSLPIQSAALLSETEMIPVRFLKGSSQELIMLPIFSFHRSMVLSNIGVLLISFIVSVIAAVFAHRYANKLRLKKTVVQPEFVFDRPEKMQNK